MAAVEVPIVVAVIVALRTDWTPVADWALIDVEVRGVGTVAMFLIGAYSRFGWNHPGPIAFYVFAPGYALSGQRPGGLALGALAGLPGGPGHATGRAGDPRGPRGDRDHGEAPRQYDGGLAGARKRAGAAADFGAALSAEVEVPTRQTA